MPIYEFYCKDLQIRFLTFFPKPSIRQKSPIKCKIKTLEKQISVVAFTGRSKGRRRVPIIFHSIAVKWNKPCRCWPSEADKINEDDPKQAANLMRKLSHMTGIKFSENGTYEALSRMEQGADPEQVEAENG